MIRQIKDKLRQFSPRPLEGDFPEAGILVLITRDEEDPQIVLTKRSEKLRAHTGQVAFPGGKQDEDDSSLEATALRECHEEIGVPPEEIEIVQRLSQVISLHGIRVTPYVGLVDPGVDMTANEEELDHIFKVSIKEILDLPPKRYDKITYKESKLEVPAFDYDYDGVTFEIWGLSSLVMSEMLHVVFGYKSPLLAEFDEK